MFSNGIFIKTIGISIVLFLIGSIGIFIVRDLAREPYPGPWQESPNIDIGETLKSQSVSNCSRYKYRKSAYNNSEYLVYCTSDGSKWTGYIILPHLHKIAMGPFEPDPALE